MAKPQQPELRRSGKVAALDPDATETVLGAAERPGTKGTAGPVPEEQRPGHKPEHEQDKPDLDDFAARLGIVPEGEEPPDAPRVEDDDGTTVTRLEDAPSKVKARRSSEPAEPQQPVRTAPKEQRPTFSPIGLALIGPITTVKIAQRVLRAVTRR